MSVDYCWFYENQVDFFLRQGDPVRDLVFRYMGEQEAIKRQILSVDSVTQDIDGLKALIVSIYTVIIHILVHCLQVYYKIAPEYDEIFLLGLITV